MRQSLLDYMAGDHFAPASKLTMEEINGLIKEP